MIMRSKSNRPVVLSRVKTFLVYGVGVALACFAIAGRAEAQTFTSGSDGSDLAFLASGAPGTIVVFDPSQFHGNQVSANIFNFTTITVQAGVTVRLSGDKISGPVYWLAQGDVNISGTIDLNGANGAALTQNPFSRVPFVPGAGGFFGGVGGQGGQGPVSGGGPTGGTAATCANCYADGGGGTFPGNSFLIPLIGGAGGGGGDRADANFGPAGGVGGG